MRPFTVIVKNPSDFVGAALGQSEQQTKGILAASQGKVLVIDEAYSLYGGGTSQGSQGDPYKTAVIDTIVAEIQSVPGDDRCVLLLGYRNQLENMFQNVNPGLSRRFPLASAFMFDDFTESDLRTILESKLKAQSYRATGQGIDVAMGMLQRARNRPNFGNGGEVDIMLNDAKARHQSRLTKGIAKAADLLEAVDFDEDFARTERAATNIQQLFKGTVGCGEIVAKFEHFQRTVQALKALDMDPKENIPFNFIFKGPPGTGKTTTAKKVGKIFYDLGFLASAQVQECSATDLIGQYVGQTGPRVQQMLDKSLGKVLFVDEAYRLAEGHFAKEAIDELVDAITKDKYHNKLVIVLAGYEADIERLMAVNEGLPSRFPEVISFRGLSADECISLLTQTLVSQRNVLKQKNAANDLVLDDLEQATEEFRAVIGGLFGQVSAQPSWANARDVLALGRSMFNNALHKKVAGSRSIVVDRSIIVDELRAFFEKRQARSVTAEDASLGRALSNMHKDMPIRCAPPEAMPAPKRSVTMTSQIKEQVKEQAHSVRMEIEEQKPVTPQPPFRVVQDRRKAKRDAGVSDEVWEQLQRDQAAEQEEEQVYQALLAAKEAADDDAEREAIVRRLIEEEERRKKEQALKEKLARMGRCPANFEWIKQAEGYRCAGGSHYISGDDLNKML